MLITSRSVGEAAKLVYDSEVVSVAPMREEEAIELLDRKLGRPDPHGSELVRALRTIPLAVSQAAAFIRARGRRCSAQQYLHKMEESRQSRSSLLRGHISLPNRDREANNSVLLT
jgi:hypothetical protein